MAPTTTDLSFLAVNMPAALAERVKRLADKHDRSVKAEIRKALREHVEREYAKEETAGTARRDP